MSDLIAPCLPMVLMKAPAFRSREFQSMLLTVPGASRIQEIHVRSHLESLSKSQFLTYSTTAMRKAGIDETRFVDRSLSSMRLHVSSAELKDVQIPTYCDGITAFGTGRVLDAAKQLAYLHQKRLAIIPSALSTNALATPFCSSTNNTAHKLTKTTIRTGYADIILVDFDYLRHSDRYNVYGLVDVLSIATALHDWDLATKQDISVANSVTYQIAQDIVTVCFQQLGLNNMNIYSAFNLIVNSGYITGMHGDGRPESGSEHIFAKAMELDGVRHGESVMHGKSVGLGLLLMSTLQENAWTAQLFKAVEKLGVLKEYVGRQDDLIRKAANVLVQMEPHPTRYSIVDARLGDLRSRSFSEGLSVSVIRRFFSQHRQVI